MDEIKSSFHCGRVLLWRELGNPKLWLVIVILVVFSYYNYSPLTLPAIDWDGDWGVLLHTLAESSAQVQDQTGVSLSILVAPEILAVFSPVEAALMSFGCIWLSAVFTGILICFFRVYISQMAGIFAAGIFVCMTLLTTSLGMVTFGRWLSFISPLTWAGFHTLDWYYSGISPSPRDLE